MQCIEYFESDFTKVIGYKKVIQKIEENRKKSFDIIDNLITKNIKKIELFQNHIIKLKSKVIQWLDELIGDSKDWILNTQSTISNYLEYSFFKEIDLIIMNQESTQLDQNIFNNQIKTLNHRWQTKLNYKLEQFKSFQEYQNLQDILKNQSQNLLQQQQQQQQQQLSQNILQLIDDSNYQIEPCYAIVFDPTGNIVVSTKGNKIEIWNFKNGRIKLIQSLQEHIGDVNCLIYSQIKTYFISGSDDSQIRLWKQLNNNKWQSSQAQDQLIIGSEKDTIEVWQVDFVNNELRFLQILQEHKSSVTSLSLNEPEKSLVSCGHDGQIIIWQKVPNYLWKLQQVVKQSIQQVGLHVKFLKEDQFIFIPSERNTVCLYQFKNNQYQESIEKKVQFKKNTQGIVNQSFFPIIYNKEKDLIFLRHIFHICILKVQQGGYLQIVQEFDCTNGYIYGTISNDGNYLIFWGQEKGKYEIYQIQQK